MVKNFYLFADSDTIFGDIGNDTRQGDGSADQTEDPTGPTIVLSRPDRACFAIGEELFSNVFEEATDGDDYIEGNGGGDTGYGGLGQDDIIGGSSNLFAWRPRRSDPMAGTWSSAKKYLIL